jgi:hypothetical protein
MKTPMKLKSPFVNARECFGVWNVFVDGVPLTGKGFGGLAEFASEAEALLAEHAVRGVVALLKGLGGSSETGSIKYAARGTDIAEAAVLSYLYLAKEAGLVKSAQRSVGKRLGRVELTIWTLV